MRRVRAEATHRYGRSSVAAAWLRILKGVALIAVVAVVSGASIAGIAAYHLASSFGHGSVDISNGGSEEIPSLAAVHGAFNVLLVGEDNAPGQKGWGASREASLNDVNILVHIAADHESGTVLSVPRDLVIAQPQCTDPKTKAVYSAESGEPLNTALARGGLGCVVATIESLTGIQVPYASLFSFEGTVQMADAVGGVPVCVTKAIDDPDSGLKLPAGRSVVKGRMALAYLRDRHGVGDGSDLARIASQQAYMSSLLRTMTSASTFTNPARLYALASAAAKNVQLSKSLADPDTEVAMALALKNLNLSRMVFVQYPTGADPENENKVVPDSELAAEVVARVKADEPIGLDKSSLGGNAALASDASGSGRSTSSDSTSGSTKKKKKHSDVIDGLRGQTATQQTCSVAFHD